MRHDFQTQTLMSKLILIQFYLTTMGSLSEAWQLLVRDGLE